jgi:hypothetical protein
MATTIHPTPVPHAIAARRERLIRLALRNGALILASAAIGTLAYLDLQTLYLLGFFPLVLVMATGRVASALVAWAFFLAPSLLLIPVIEQWVAGTGQPIPNWAFTGYPLLLSVLLTAPFLLVDPRATPTVRGIQMASALLILTLPPLGLIAWLNPVLLAAAIYPGIGLILGAILGLITLSLIAMRPWRRDCPSPARLAFSVLLVTALACHVIHDHRQPPVEPIGWFGVETRYGPLAPIPEAIDFRAELVAQDAREYLRFPETKLLVFPESTFSAITPQVIPRAIAPLQRDLRKRDAIALVGITTPRSEHPEAFNNALLLVEPDGPPSGTVIARSRVPVPVGGWRTGGRGVPVRAFASGLIHLHDQHIHLTFCYEDFLLWTNRQADRATLLISVASAWMLTPTIDRYQTTAIRAMARMSRKPLIRAVNRMP